MKTNLVFALLVFLCLLPVQIPGHAVGIVVGEPTGFRFRYDLRPARLMNFGLGWSFIDYHNNGTVYHDNLRITIHGDYIFQFPDPLQIGERYELYCGPGLLLNTSTNDLLGLRIVGGLNVHLGQSPIDVFFELVPVMTIITETRPNLNVGLGLNFKFK